MEYARRLDTRSMQRGVRCLTREDHDLAAVVRRHGPPPLWTRPPGLGTLIRIILEQQVSLASARAVYRRLEQTLGEITPGTVGHCGTAGLRHLGVTRQKAAYCIDLANRVSAGELNLRRIARAPAEVARAELMRVKGIGPWTADIYLLMVLRRPDIWPTGDLALLTALQHLRRLPRRPTSEQAAAQARRWVPWRAVAARILWHGYLAGSLATNRPSE
ncbi:MAG: DNA-3-methyladenine glycosylase 2 family protein [Gemmatimonadetes bacterium]|nr:DNA-3-methyladenine glycosylase 2 family protein [Gemmatimonadota bacterium]